MWHTSRGDRTLRGAEAVLVGTAIETMIDALLVHIDDAFEDPMAADCQSGIAVYDLLSATQRVGLLHDVAEHLLTQTESAMPLSAMVEATVAAVYVEIRDQVAIEIDLFPADASDEQQRTWRGLVLAAYEEVFQTRRLREFDSEQEQVDDAADVPHETSIDITRWEKLIHNLTDAILWDRDFEMAEGFLDADPGVSRHRRRLLGIDEDYFTRVAPDPRPEEVLRLAEETRDIVRAKPR